MLARARNHTSHICTHTRTRAHVRAHTCTQTRTYASIRHLFSSPLSPTPPPPHTHTHMHTCIENKSCYLLIMLQLVCLPQFCWKRSKGQYNNTTNIIIKERALMIVNEYANYALRCSFIIYTTFCLIICDTHKISAIFHYKDAQQVSNYTKYLRFSTKRMHNRFQITQNICDFPLKGCTTDFKLHKISAIFH